jgi:hypothetical protein
VLESSQNCILYENSFIENETLLSSTSLLVYRTLSEDASQKKKVEIYWRKFRNCSQKIGTRRAQRHQGDTIVTRYINADAEKLAALTEALRPTVAEDI